MNRLIGMAVAAGLGLSAGPALAAEAPIKVLIKPGMLSATKGGNVDVAVTVPHMDAAAGTSLFRIGLFIPGASKAQDIKDVILTDARGSTPLTPPKGERGGWTASRPVKGDVTVRYRLFIDNALPLVGGPPTGLRIDGDGFSGTGGSLIMAPQVKGDYPISIKWDLSGMAPGAEGVTSFGDGDLELPTGSLDRLDDSLWMAGHVKRAPEKTTGAFSSVWTGEPPFDPQDSMLWTSKLHAWMSKFFKDTSEPPYRVFLRFNPMNAGGGAALIHSFIATYGPGVNGENLKSILGHEMTHTWTSTRLGKWYNEGDAVFYQARLAWRAGLISDDKFLADLNETASRYYTNIKMHTPEDYAVSHFWEDTRVRVLPYDRGAMYFAVLDNKIRKASGGKRSVDDLVLAMVQRARDNQPISTEIWLNMLRKEIGEEGPQIHESMISGKGVMLPDSDEYGPCFQRTTKKIRRFDLGFDNASFNPTAKVKVIQGLIPGSEADKAGIRNGDVVTYGVALDAVQGELDHTLTLHVTRGGKTFDITYLPRGEAVDAYQWEHKPGVPAGTVCTF